MSFPNVPGNTSAGSSSTSSPSSSFSFRRHWQNAVAVFSPRARTPPTSSPLVPSPSSFAPPSEPPQPAPPPYKWRCSSCGQRYATLAMDRCLICSRPRYYGRRPRTPRKMIGKMPEIYRGNPQEELAWLRMNEWRRSVLEYSQDSDRYKAESMKFLGSINESNPEWADESKKLWLDQCRYHVRELGRKQRFIMKQHNCFVDCEYPGQCHEVWANANEPDLDTTMNTESEPGTPSQLQSVSDPDTDMDSIPDIDMETDTKPKETRADSNSNNSRPNSLTQHQAAPRPEVSSHLPSGIIISPARHRRRRPSERRSIRIARVRAWRGKPSPLIQSHIQAPQN